MQPLGHTARTERYPGRHRAVLDADLRDVPEAADVAAPQAVNVAELIEDTLLDGQHPLDNLHRTLQELEALIVTEANRRAGATIAELLHKLPGPTGEALRRVVLGDRGESLRDAAKRVGCSHVSLIRAEHRIRRRLPACA